MPTLPPAPLNALIETALYVGDLDVSKSFYVDVLGCYIMSHSERLLALSVADRSVLLLFDRNAGSAPVKTQGGTVPAHGASGAQHVGFAIPPDSLEAWRARLAAADVAIESEVSWERGGHSLYLRDPDGHSIELLTPGLWAVY
jgi:catechol 2,3-dioxygenase-like lactoylglutathione lyase family enzyme